MHVIDKFCGTLLSELSNIIAARATSTFDILRKYESFLTFYYGRFSTTLGCGRKLLFRIWYIIIIFTFCRFFLFWLIALNRLCNSLFLIAKPTNFRLRLLLSDMLIMQIFNHSFFLFYLLAKWHPNTAQL